MEPKRLLLPGFISRELCQELVFIHKSCGVVGYRPHVFSTTLSHLVATNSAGLIMPFIALREKVKEAVEEFFGCEFELFVEFTGLISWTTGANIGWHSDDNRDYLRQRHFSAVCYLNTYEQDFRGGLFHFQDGEPATVIPTLGTVLVYSANEDNVHSVDEVVDGERITMALWFTRDATHDEDKKIIDQLINVLPLLHDKQDKLCGENASIASQPSQAPGNAHNRDHFLPLPASSMMYRVSISKTESKTGHDVGCESSSATERIIKEEDQGHDVRVERLASLGYQCVVQQNDQNSVFEMPVRLKYQQQDMTYKFANILHALQVVQFHEWRSTGMAAPCSSSSSCTDHQVVQAPKQDEFQDSKRPRTSKWAPSCSCSQRLVSEKNLEETMVKPWENYNSTLLTSLLQMIRAWRNMGSLYSREMLKEC